MSKRIKEGQTVRLTDPMGLVARICRAYNGARIPRHVLDTVGVVSSRSKDHYCVTWTEVNAEGVQDQA
jgi:hypothetical protein